MCVFFFFSGIEDNTDKEEKGSDKSDSDSEDEDEDEKETFDDDLQPLETPYVMNQAEELGKVRLPQHLVLLS